MASGRRGKAVKELIWTSLTLKRSTVSLSPEGERKGLNSRIKKFDLEGSVFDLTLLPDELIETGIPDLAGAVRGGIKSTIVAGRGAVQCHLKAHRLTILGRT